MLCQWRAGQLFAEAEGEVSLSTQAYKWELANLMLGVTLGQHPVWTQGVQTFLVINATETKISSGLACV